MVSVYLLVLIMSLLKYQVIVVKKLMITLVLVLNVLMAIDWLDLIVLLIRIMVIMGMGMVMAIIMVNLLQYLIVKFIIMEIARAVQMGTNYTIMLAIRAIHTPTQILTTFLTVFQSIQTDNAFNAIIATMFPMEHASK